MSNNKQSIDFSDRIIREAECRHLTGLCRTTRYVMEKKGTFPARCQLGGRSVGWRLSEVQGWIANQLTTHTSNAA
ncbi:AlpA family phage regulatory protein [Salmonella enterica subsp. enterica serovar Sekondi]|uniref:AlpA family phage regulatory protein n=1 Tax=Salmonella enterica subsp. enterica serovar Ouagadougou TaxID=2564899 RepID=A0A5I0D2U3_SALET|nr:AlpA family phage regulatory protein [Salmonella enterica]EAA7110264.1 AlpA family phage regulatory protein [Salmonella enterica subsp. enterica serovar Ouagadougou]ECD4598852.1 AlpA family phage regulatory protein [Salmonella enterica subsp. enterica serovar Waycross]ECI6683930.1 AlpA family phage regulatory protein [Salmonella enterica subsp. enterica]ECY3516776.1 AlpA family phage regulatory protein [Salmonella enterica subsp. enterica serovar Sekondi]EBR9513791.1 AlpA family phage regul